MKLSQLLGELPYGVHDVEITDVTNDSRKVAPGMAFVCINGTNIDGHKYAVAAANKGAVAVIAEHNVGVCSQVIVPDTKYAYAKMCSALYGNPKDQLKLIGVTGTNGKTTTTFLIKNILEQFGKKVGLIGTIHNMICDAVIPTENTTPDAHELHRIFREMVDAGCEYAVMEVSSHALEQERVAGLRFAAGVFTNLTQDHLDYHLTMDNYVLAKKKLFSMTDVAVINSDDKYAKQMIDGIPCAVSTYAVDDKCAEYRALDLNYRADGVSFSLENGGRVIDVSVRTPGRFSVYNALAAAGCIATLGFDLQETLKYLSRSVGVKGRAEVVETGRDFTVIIDYAHTPDGLENVLNTFNEIKTDRLVVLFGCGGDRDATKRPRMGKIAAQLADYCIVTSDNPRTEDPAGIIDDILVGMKDTKTPYTVIENRREAIHYAVKNAQKGDIIVLAGKGHETYQIIMTAKNHFDEREIVQEALAELS